MLLASVLIELGARQVDQLIQTWVRIEAAVGAIGREFAGVEDVFEDVRVFIAADPAQRIELKEAVSDVGKESCELEGADV